MKRAFALLTIVALAACNDSTSPTAAVGAYGLASFDGVAVPFTETSTSTETVVLVSETLSINPDGTWSDVANENVTFNNNPQTTQSQQTVTSGTWSISGSSITLSGDVFLSGTISGNTITFLIPRADGSSDVAVYSR